jgi:prepilin-type N-terminal cleavage/methylation domain-containing protein
MKKITKNKTGFTLIELLLVIAVIAAMAVTVFVALNPAGRLQNARNSKRVTDVDSYLSAVQQYIVDNGGTLPAGIATTSDSMIGTCSTTPAVATGGCNVLASSACFNASTTLAKYLASAPMDPLATLGFASSTDYAITASATTSIVTIKACGQENATGGQIWASR